MKHHQQFQACVDVNNEKKLEDCYRKMEPYFLALDHRKLLRVSVSPQKAVATVLAVLPRIQALRARIALLVEIDSKEIDLLEDCALAFIYAHFEYLAVVGAKDDLPAIHQQAIEIRRQLYSDLTALAKRDFIDPDCLRCYTGQTGYERVASDIFLLTHIARKYWDRIEGRCPTDKEGFAHAERLANHVMRFLTRRELIPLEIKLASDRRKRAFTLMFRYYETSRRAITFLRWNERDADAIAPALHATQKRTAVRAAALEAEAAETQTQSPDPDQGLDYDEDQDQGQTNSQKPAALATTL